MAGPWDKYKPAAPTGPWDKYKPKTSDTTTDTSSVGAVVRKAVDAAELGYSPQIEGAIASPYQALLALGGADEKDIPDYIAKRDATIKQLKSDAENHPYISGAGTVGGSILGSVPLASLKVLQGAAEARPYLTAAMTGLGMGALSNPGDTVGQVDPLQAKERSINAAIGGVAGPVLQKGGELVNENIISPVTNKIADFIGARANGRAFSSLNPMEKGVRENRQNIQAIGRNMLDEGNIGKIPVSYEKLAQRIDASKAASGQKLGDLAHQINPFAEYANSDDIAKQAMDGLLQTAGVPGAETRNKALTQYVTEFKNDAMNQMPLTQARDYKAKIGPNTDWRNILHTDDQSAKGQASQALYHALQGYEDTQAQKLAELGAAGASEFIPQKVDYGLKMRQSEIANKAADKDWAARMLSLGDRVGGGALGALAGGIYGNATGDHGTQDSILGGIIGAGMGRAGRRYGNQVAAKYLYGTENLLRSIPQSLMNNPALKQILLQNELRQTPWSLLKEKQNEE